jgi:hypothetical protein
MCYQFDREPLVPDPSTFHNPIKTSTYTDIMPLAYLLLYYIVEDKSLQDLLNSQTTVDKSIERKGKPAEKRGRKTTGLNSSLSGHDSRVAEQ